MNEPLAKGPAPAETARTLGRLYLEAERSRVRRDVVRWAAEGGWRSVPGWRFYRQVMRIGLFLRERFGLRPGDPVLVDSPLRVERVVAEWAVVSAGGVALWLDGDRPLAGGAQAGGVAPKVAFVAKPADAARWLGSGGDLSADRVVVFDPAAAGEGGPVTRSWSEVLDLGGTLDTAERAESYRADARAIEPDRPALAYRERGNGGAVTRWTHEEAVRRVREFWRRVPPGDGDVAYVTGDAPRAGPCVPVWAFVADGRTSTVLGAPGRDASGIAELRPHVVVSSDPAGGASAFRAPGEAGSWGRAVERLRLAGDLLSRLAPAFRDGASRRRVRSIVSFDGVLVDSQSWRFQWPRSSIHS